jgi:hypothetical protein
MLARAFEVQDKLKIVTLGEGKWEAVSSRKVLVHTGFTVPLCELMILVRIRVYGAIRELRYRYRMYGS